MIQDINTNNNDKNIDDFDEFNAIKIANLSLNDKKKLLEYLYSLLPINQKAILFLQVYWEVLTEERCYSLEECRFIDDCYKQAIYQRLAVKNKNVLEFNNSFTKIYNEVKNDNGLSRSSKKLYIKKVFK